MKILISVLCLVVGAFPVIAHSPVLNPGNFAMTKADPFVIEDPEHSKAIFSTLNGEPHYYEINSPSTFNFYVGITAPKNESCELQKTFSFDVLDKSFETIDARNGSSFTWWSWYEEWGKKWYWVGPEIGNDFKSDRTYSAGIYYIRISNEQNVGKYVLAVGDIERFGLAEIFSLRKTVSEINAAFWNEQDCVNSQ